MHLRFESSAAAIWRAPDSGRTVAPPSDGGRVRRKYLALLLLITLLALLVHGYHPAVEDGGIYLPGVKKLLDPALYPNSSDFFLCHAHWTMFDEMVAGSVRLTRMPFDYAIFLWQIGSIFMLLWACLRMGRACFKDPAAAWGGTALVAALLTIPVAGTALYIMDQYITARAFFTPAAMLMMVCAMERRFVRSCFWMAFTALVHPLMCVFGLSILLFFFLEEQRPALLYGLQQLRKAQGTAALLLLPLFPPVTEAYGKALDTRLYFFPLRWSWPEWLGIFIPLVLLLGLMRYGRRRGLQKVEQLSRALVVFGAFYLTLSLVLTVPARFGSFVELQPMRSFQLLYVMLFVLLGGVLGQSVMKRKLWRWAAVFVPLCLGMFFAQRQLFPATPHLELPGAVSPNPWVRAFEWVRGNTPREAVFALDPYHMILPGEDQHGFRALAERDMLADAVKDSGAVTMFPELARTWNEQMKAQQGWRHFQLADFQRLRRKCGITWVIVRQPGVPGLDCRYENEAVRVCRIP